MPTLKLQATRQPGNFAGVFAVSKASRFAFLFGPPAKRRYSRECSAGRLAYGGTAKRGRFAYRKGKAETLCLRKWLKAPRLTCVFAILTSLLPAYADPAPGVSKGTAAGAGQGTFATVSHLGESDQQAALREGQLLSHRRATDPFGNVIRGPYKGLPPVVAHPSATPGPSAASASSAAASPAVNEPTIEKAVEELVIGAVNVGAHEILIGSRSIREGDLLVLESGGRQFAVWVQSVGMSGVFFCDIDIKKHLLKSFGSGPRELPGDSVWGLSDIHHYLNKNASP